MRGPAAGRKESDARAALVRLFVVAIALGFASACSDDARAPHGVILIIPDSLRADRVGAYGYPRPTTPHLDDLARRGVVFESAFSQSSWTTPSVASIFTSVYPSVHRVGHLESDHGYTAVLSPRLHSLAEILQKGGYRTAALLNNPSISVRRGFSRGFGEFVNDERPAAPTAPSDAAAVAMLEALSTGDFFLFWHILDPHWPNWPPPEFRNFVDPTYTGRFRDGFPRKYVKTLTSGILAISDAERRHIGDLYDGEVRYADHQIGALFAAIERLDLWDRVSVIVTSDHGESLLERGHYGHSLPMYEETLHVPLIVYDSRLAPARIPLVVESIDIFPTILELAERPIPLGLQGRSLLPLLEGRVDAWSAGPAWSESPQFFERKSLRTGRHRLIWGATGLVLRDDFQPGGELWQFTSLTDRKLYDVAEGPKAADLAAAEPERTEAMMERVHRIVRSNEARQVDDRSMLRTFYFDGDWRSRAIGVKGRIERDGDAIVIDHQPRASVHWRVDFPKDLQHARIVARAHCDGPTAFLAASGDGESWNPILWPSDDYPEFADIGVSMDVSSGRSLAVTFKTPDSRCALASFRVHGFFEAGEPAVDDLTREHLRALGYVEELAEPAEPVRENAP